MARPRRPREVHAVMWTERGRWCGRLSDDPETGTVSAPSRSACLARLREVAGPEAVLTVEVTPELVGVAEAAAILGWDKRRIFTYLSRRSFPDPLVALASGRVWRREAIEAYARTWRRRSVRDGAGPAGPAGAAGRGEPV